MDRAHDLGRRQPGGAAGALRANPVARDRRRWRRAGWPTTCGRSDGKPTTVAPDDVPRLLARQRPRDDGRGVQRGASDYIAAYQIRVDDAVGRNSGRDPVASGARDLHGAGDRRRRDPQHHCGRLRIPDRCAAGAGRAAGRTDPAARKSPAGADGIGSVVHATARRAHAMRLRTCWRSWTGRLRGGRPRAPVTETART